MKEKMVSIGYENYLDKDRIVAVLAITSNPARRIIKEAEENGTLIDVTSGKKRQSIILTEGKQVYVTARTPPTIVKKITD